MVGPKTIFKTFRNIKSNILGSICVVETRNKVVNNNIGVLFCLNLGKKI